MSGEQERANEDARRHERARRAVTELGDFGVMWRLLGLVRPLAGWMLFAVACGVAGFACAIALPTLGAAWLANVYQVTVYELALTLVALAVTRGVLHYLEQRTNHYIAFRLLAHVRDQVFAALRRLAPAKLAGADRGSLVSALTSDIELLEVFFAHTISPVCIAALTCVGMVALLARVSWAFALVSAVAYLVVGVAVPLATSRACGDAGLRSREGQASLSSYVLDGLRGLSEVLQYGAGERRLAGLDKRGRELVEVQRGLSSVTGVSAAVASVLISAATLVQLGVGLALAGRGAVAAADAVVATVALASSFGPVVALANLGTTLQGTLGSARRVLAILEEEPQVDEVAGGERPEFTGLEVRDVSFAYEDDSEPVLEHVSLAVEPGRIVGVTGASGAGKSTLARLCMRFWDPDEGHVLVGGTDVRAVDTDWLRGVEAFVEQDAFLFNATIRENLLIAKPDATQEELEAACRAASVHDFVAGLPGGYDTPVGELGEALSGGERQRLGLARAFLHDAELLILDEPTSNVDALNEGQIVRSLAAERGRRAVLLVSHRASTMAIADATYIM